MTMKTLLMFFLMLTGIVISAQEIKSDSICKALFKYEVNDKLMMPYAATAINFYDVSVGKVKEWYWDFGEGNTSREQNPMFIFKHPVSSPNVKINPYRIISLTISTGNCKSFYSIMINILNGTTYVEPHCLYVMRIKSGFPTLMSSCTGWAQAQVFLKDSAIKATDYSWSTGVTGQDVKNLCPTYTYTVKAKTDNGCVVACTFILNSDGTIKEMPVTWWVNGSRENMYVQYNLNNKNLNAEWKFPDGTIVKTDSVSLNPMYGGSEILDLIVRDSTGTIVYTEKIAIKSIATDSRFDRQETSVNLYPNPVKDILYAEFNGYQQKSIQLNVVDLSGRTMANMIFIDIPSRYTFGLDIKKLPEGVYLCRLLMDTGEVIVKKFIK
jgi:hypothetical protein